MHSRKAPPRRATRRPEGFTLVELLVALALAAVISVSIMFISTQARSAYEETVARVDVYNRFRYALQAIEQDLRQWIPTGDLEFYADGAGRSGDLNGHWDPGEEYDDRSDARGPGVRDGGVRGEYDEFPYIVQKHYTSREPFQAEQKIHDAYEVYFRTMTYVDGGIRVANVEYRLADMQKDFVNGQPVLPEFVENEEVAGLSLIKIVRYQKIDQDIILKQTDVPVIRRVIEVATNVTDFRVEYTVENRFAPRHQGVTPGFRTPKQDYEQPAERILRPSIVGGRNRGAGRVYRKLFGYGTVRLGVQDYPKAVAYPALGGDQDIGPSQGHEPVTVGFQNHPLISFAELTPGDSIYIFTESSRAEASGVSSTDNAGRLVRFLSDDYTIKTNRNGLLELKEDIDSSGWNNETQSNLYYKAAYLPTALRVTLRIVDDDGMNPKTMQKEVWLRRRNR